MKNKKIKNIKKDRKIVFYLKFIFSLLLLILKLFLPKRRKRKSGPKRDKESQGFQGEIEPQELAEDPKRDDKDNKGKPEAKRADGTKGVWATKEALNKLSIDIHLLKNPGTTKKYEKFKKKITVSEIHLRDIQQFKLFQAKDKGAVIDSFNLSKREKISLKNALGIK